MFLGIVLELKIKTKSAILKALNVVPITRVYGTIFLNVVFVGNVGCTPLIESLGIVVNRYNEILQRHPQIPPQNFPINSDKKYMLFQDTSNKVFENAMRLYSDVVHELIVEKQHNARGAGRKIRFTDQERETVKMYRLQGKT